MAFWAAFSGVSGRGVRGAAIATEHRTNARIMTIQRFG